MAVLLAALVAYPASASIGPDWRRWVDLYARTDVRKVVAESEHWHVFCGLGAIMGCWLGAFAIPLDWDMPWQVRVSAARFAAFTQTRLTVSPAKCRLNNPRAALLLAEVPNQSLHRIDFLPWYWLSGCCCCRSEAPGREKAAKKIRLIIDCHRLKWNLELSSSSSSSSAAAAAAECM